MSQSTHVVEQLDETVNAGQQTAILRCSCGKSARFIPLYRFSADAPTVSLTHPHTIKCAECGQWYVWIAGSDGWARTGQLDDLDRLTA